jgi:hypothetical protein
LDGTTGCQWVGKTKGSWTGVMSFLLEVVWDLECDAKNGVCAWDHGRFVFRLRQRVSGASYATTMILKKWLLSANIVFFFL